MLWLAECCGDDAVRRRSASPVVIGAAQQPLGFGAYVVDLPDGVGLGDRWR